MPLIVTPSELERRAELYHQLGATVSAGIPLLKSLEMLATNPVARNSRKAILQILKNLRSGASFTGSIANVHDWLPEFDKALLSAGEKSGRLDSSFQLLAVHYRNRSRIIRSALTDLLMTAVTLHVFLFLFPLGLLVKFAQGILASNFSDCAPFIMQKVIIFGGIYSTIFLFAYACQGSRGERWRSIVESLASIVPLLGTSVRFLNLSRLAATLEALIRSGVSIITSWQIAASASGSPFLRRVVAKWQVLLDDGTTPAELVNRTRYFPEMFGHLYFSGEESGQLDDSLHRLHIYYQEEGFRLLRLFTRVFNGIIYGLLVLLVAYNVISFYVGYYGAMMNSF